MLRKGVLFGTGTAFVRFRSQLLRAARVEKESQEPKCESEVPLTPDMSLAAAASAAAAAARLRRSSLANQLPLTLRLTIDNAKNVIFYYLLFKYLLKGWRRLVAHGPLHTVLDGWRWLSLVRDLQSLRLSICVQTASCPFFLFLLLQQVILLAMRLPSTRAKVEAEIAKARQDIITKLIPQGPNVTRHISLPSQGQSAQWIAQEMERMDAESENTGLWRQGKLSGAVYRTSRPLTPLRAPNPHPHPHSHPH